MINNFQNVDMQQIRKIKKVLSIVKDLHFFWDLYVHKKEHLNLQNNMQSTSQVETC